RHPLSPSFHYTTLFRSPLVVVIHAVHPVERPFGGALEKDHLQTGELLEHAAADQGDERLVCGGVFEKFPGLKVVFFECTAEWPLDLKSKRRNSSHVAIP